MVETL